MQRLRAEGISLTSETRERKSRDEHEKPGIEKHVSEKIAAREDKDSSEKVSDMEVTPKEALDELEVEEGGRRLKIEGILREAFKELEWEELQEHSVRELVRDALEELEELEKSKGEVEEVQESPKEEIQEIQEAPKEEVSDRFDEYDQMLETHSHLRRKNPPERYEEYESYREVMRAPEEVSDEELAERFDIEPEQVRRCRDGDEVPRLVKNIERRDLERIAHEREVSEEVLGHRIEPETVREVLREAVERERLGPEELAEVVERLYRAVPESEGTRVDYAELYEPGSSLVGDELREVAREILAHRLEIQGVLNERLGLDENSEREVRIAVVDDKLVYWTKCTSQDNWYNVLAGEKFYFKSKEDKVRMIDDTQRHLHVRGGPETSQHYLGELMNQLTTLETPRERRFRRYEKPPYIDGEALQFMGDVRGTSLEDLKPKISHLGMRKGGRIYNPQFPSINEYRMKLVAIIESDGHYSLDKKLSYFEKNPERKEIAIREMNKLGDVEVHICPNREHQVMFPKVVANIADYFGIPRGDKAIRNLGLPEIVINETLENKARYPRQMVGEDGWHYNGTFGVSRHHVLHAGDKADDYEKRFGIKPLVTQEHIDFVCDTGNPMPEDKKLGYKEDERRELRWTKLRELAENPDQNIARIANELVKISRNNPNRLIRSEKEQIAKPLGIEMAERTDSLIYYRNSKRLSVSTVIYTRSKYDAIRWALLSPPDHPKKMRKVVKFLKEKPEDVKIVMDQIHKDGLTIHPEWEEYDI